jgi:glutathione S-transferase
VLEMLDYIVGSVHMRGFTLFMVPQKFVQSDAAKAELAEYGRKIATQALVVLSEHLGEQDYLFTNFTIADAALFYITEWAQIFNVEMLANLHSFNQRMRARPLVSRAISLQGQ